MNSAAAAAVCGLWRYTSVICLCTPLPLQTQLTVEEEVRWSRVSDDVAVVSSSVGDVDKGRKRLVLTGRRSMRSMKRNPLEWSIDHYVSLTWRLRHQRHLYTFQQQQQLDRHRPTFNNFVQENVCKRLRKRKVAFRGG